MNYDKVILQNEQLSLKTHFYFFVGITGDNKKNGFDPDGFSTRK